MQHLERINQWLDVTKTNQMKRNISNRSGTAGTIVRGCGGRWARPSSAARCFGRRRRCCCGPLFCTVRRKRGTAAARVECMSPTGAACAVRLSPSPCVIFYFSRYYIFEHAINDSNNNKRSMHRRTRDKWITRKHTNTHTHT